MRKIDYESIYKQIGEKQFEQEFLFVLGLGNYDTGKFSFSNEYYNLQKKYDNCKQLFSCCPVASFFPKDLKTLLLLDFHNIIDLFLSIELGNKAFPETLKNNLKNILNYEKFSEKIHSFFNKYSNTLKLNICPYCESSYTGFYNTQDKANPKKILERSIYDLDHFFPKAEYPIFSLSLYNFIPSCQICNSRVKASNKFIKFYNIDLSARSRAKAKLLQISPASPKYNFNNSVFIRYIPNVLKDSQNNYIHWNYEPLSQNNSDKYKVLFDYEEDSLENNATIIKSMQLEDRYNSSAIKSKGLYLLDLKKRYPLSHINKIAELLSKNGLFVSQEEIENAIFHKNEMYKLHEKMYRDILE